MRPGGEGGHAGAVCVTGAQAHLLPTSLCSCSRPRLIPVTIAPALSDPLRSSDLCAISGHLNTLICAPGA